MRWVEVIRLRSSSQPRESIIDAIRRATVELARGATPNVRIYRHHSVPSDLSVHLHHESSGRAPEPSALALHLVTALSEMGLTEHSCWIEATEEIEP